MASVAYKGRQSPSGAGTPRVVGEHGAKLRREFSQAFTAFDDIRPTDDSLDPPEGSFVEVELARNAKVTNLDMKQRGIFSGAVNLAENETRIVGLYVPDDKKEILDSILAEYGAWEAGDDSPKNPPRSSFVNPIESVRAARLETYWTDDPAALPQNPNDVIWWEVWCAKNCEDKLDAMVETLGARAAEADKRLYFYEHVVVPVLARRETIEILLFAQFAITELRRATDSPQYYIDELETDEAIEWTEDLADRVRWPNQDAPAVCLLDTGVNRAHFLIEPTLSEDDMNAVDLAWGNADSLDGHGTGMAGLALFGDLIYHLGSTDERVLTHRLESVKILPPAGFSPTEERFYGSVMRSAVAIPESVNADRKRVFCLAVTNENRSGHIPSTWSSAIDQEAAGISITGEEAPKRLFFVSAGNAPNEIHMNRIVPCEELPIEDPAQAWNAVAVGGYTDKVDIQEPDISDHTPMVNAGELSPFTRTSLPWTRFKTPFKPDIVMEAGNRAVNAAQTEAYDVNSLSLLSTGPNIGTEPLVPFNATSAATAQAARLGVRIMADNSDYWPEMIRALIIHGAEWTVPMVGEFTASPNMTSRAQLLRKFGHGVPTFERANASAANHLALLSQATIQPFRSNKGRKGFGDCHFYDLPWPMDVLETLGDAIVKVKLTLSYFVEPNPGASATVDPFRYQSFGLRFDLRRRGETADNFKKRINHALRAVGEGTFTADTDTDNWQFGPSSISAGSLHCDEWTGPAASLLTRDTICIRPVTGWWKTRADSTICNRKARYALVVSLKTDDVNIDLHTPIQEILTTVTIET